VDEAQDTSSEQWAVLRLIMSTASTTLVVYDTNQCIYGWSGADKSFIQSLGLLMDSTKFSLTQNFRSGEAIGKLANRVCVDQRSQIKTLPGAEAVLTLQLFESRQEEVDFVLSTLTTKTGTRAVLARTNSYLELFERACLDSNIPYTGTGFYRTAPCVSLCEFLQEYEGSNAVSLARKAFLENGGYGKEEKADLQIALRIVADEGAAVFIERVLKSLDLQNKEQDSALILSTGHCSKGREWDAVAVCGVHSGQMPHSMSTDEEEERNLLYVMITRARSELLITAVGAYSPLIPADVY
jgi:superfamily I DNA/RNA helicase